MTTRSLLIETEDYAGVFLVRMNLYFLLWFFTFIFFISCVRAANAAALSIQKDENCKYCKAKFRFLYDVSAIGPCKLDQCCSSLMEVQSHLKNS